MATPIPPNAAPFTAAALAIATGGTLVRGTPDGESIGLCTDTRALAAGNVFLALRGEKVDGHRFLSAAIAGGARALVVGRDAEVPPIGRGEHELAVIAVDDTTIALGAVARFHRLRWEHARRARSVVIAITGSAGKTTTKELTAAALIAALGEEAVLVTRGNLNNRVGVPMTLLGLEPRHAAAVIEAGVSLRGEMKMLADVILPDVCLLTMIGVAHAEGLKVRGESASESIAREKGALVALASRYAVACADDVWASAAVHFAPRSAHTVTYGRDPRANYHVLRVTNQTGAPRELPSLLVDIERPVDPSRSEDGRDAQRVEIRVPLLGEVAVLNVCGALAAADCAMTVLGRPRIQPLPFDEVLRRRVRAVHGRLAPRRRTDGALVLDDSYNASPDSYVVALDTARKLAAQAHRRLVVVVGEMRELGEITAAAHDALGAQVVRVHPTLVVTCGGAADRVADVVEGAAVGIPVLRARDSAKAAALLVPVVAADHLVLVKGSRSVATEVVVDAIMADGGEIVDSVGKRG